MRELLFWILWNPLPVFLFIIGVGLANLWWKRREGRLRLLAVTIPYLLLVLFSTPAFVYVLRGVLEWQYPPLPLEYRPADAEAIVVLGSHLVADDEATGELALDKNARARCLRAAKLYRAGEPRPVLVSGGRAGSDQPSVAAVMRDLLIEQGVSASDIIVEEQSTDTHENAVECRRVLDEHGWHKIVLVTNASHLVRAVGCFRKQGIETVGCGCHYQSTPESRGRHMYWPHPQALKNCPAVCYEWLGLAWYWVRGRI